MYKLILPMYFNLKKRKSFTKIYILLSEKNLTLSGLAYIHE